KATAGTRRRKTVELPSDESLAEVEVKEEPVFAQDVNTVQNPVPHVQSENETAKLLRTVRTPSTNQPEPAPSEGNGKVDAPPKSKLPARPVPEQRLPGRVVISQQSLVGNFLKKRFAVPVVAGVVVLALIVLSAFVYSRKEAEPSGLHAQATGAANAKREMILIEGGSFTMGSNNSGDKQKGEHTVTVPSFYLDKYEVTNAEYAEFIKDTNKPAPSIDSAVKEGYWKPWSGKNPPAGLERWPVANVSPKDVEAFAAWLSKRDGVTYRLPTEEEWEYAARNGSKDSMFPWGNSWEEGRANINEKKSPVDVGSFPWGATQPGLQDMVGNVWEWTSSKPRFYDGRPFKGAEANARVVRGGSFFEKINSDFKNVTDRYWFGDENFKFPTIGFRLARDRE